MNSHDSLHIHAVSLGPGAHIYNAVEHMRVFGDKIMG